MQTIISKSTVANEVKYQVQGRHGVYAVTRIGKTIWICTCPATCLCHHIREAVQSEAAAKGFYAQFCKTEEAMLRQRRRHFEITAKNKPVFVVYRNRRNPQIDTAVANVQTIGEQIAAKRQRMHCIRPGTEYYQLRGEIAALGEQLDKATRRMVKLQNDHLVKHPPKPVYATGPVYRWNDAEQMTERIV